MKLSYNEGRTDKNGNAYEANHNSRELTSGAWNINHELTPFNTYLCFDEEEHAIQRRDFESFELDYYRKHFSEGIDAINNKYEKSGHKSDVHTLEERYKSEKFCPKECIIQVAKWNELRQEHEYSLDPDLLLKSALEWVKEIQKEFPQFKVLDLALHMDETSPHIHVRGVFIGHDKEGHELPSQAKALKEMKVEKTCISAEKSKSRRYNNAAVTFETKSRGLMEDIVEKIAGITLDRERGEGGLDRGDYIRRREKELLEGAKREAEKMMSEAKEYADKTTDEADNYYGKITQDADHIRAKAWTQAIIEAKDDPVVIEEAIKQLEADPAFNEKILLENKRFLFNKMKETTPILEAFVEDCTIDDFERTRSLGGEIERIPADPRYPNIGRIPAVEINGQIFTEKEAKKWLKAASLGVSRGFYDDVIKEEKHKSRGLHH